MVFTRIRLAKLAEEQAALLGSFTQIRTDLLREATRFTPEQVLVPFIGSWNILDLLAHLVGWDYTNLQSAKDILKGKVPEFYSQYDRDWASYNAGLVSRYKLDDLEKMLARARASHADLIAYMVPLTPDQFHYDHGVRNGDYKVIISRLISAEEKDETRHLSQIRNFLGEA